MSRLRSLAGALLVLTACNGDNGTGPNAIESVSVSAPFTNVIVGAITQFTATARDADGSVVSTGTITWTSSAPAVATVDQTGLVSAVGPGQADIMARAGGVTGSLLVAVDPNPSGSAVVSMPGFTFTPFTTTINVGGTVVFEFGAEAHNVIFGMQAGVPADILPTSNRRVPRTFHVAGDFPYDCTLHPGMQGIVLVR